MTKYLIIKRVIDKRTGNVYDPGDEVEITMTKESEKALIANGCIKKVHRKRIKPLTEVIEDGTNDRRD